MTTRMGTRMFQEAKSLAKTFFTVIPVMLVFRDYVGNVGTVYGPSMQVSNLWYELLS